MEKYIIDAIHNSLRTIAAGTTRPQKKAIAEIVRGLFTKGEPILRRLAQNEDASAKKQGEKYGYHLGKVDLTETVEVFALRKVASVMRRNTVIVYDCTDINKENAKTMEGLGGIWDGSEGKGGQGYELHGVGVNGTLLALRVQIFWKLRNIVALVQLVVVLSTSLFHSVLKSTYTLVVALLQVYKLFLRKQSLSVNIASFVSPCHR